MTHSLEDYIMIVENALPALACDAVLSEYAGCDDWVCAKVGMYDGSVKVDTNTRDCMVIRSSAQEFLIKNPEVRQNLDTVLFNASAKAISAYTSKFPFCNIAHDSGYDLLKYEVNGHFGEHVDAFSQNARVVSCSFALNDNFEGGEFAFFGRQIKYSVPKGAAILFPSSFSYPHEILPVTKGTRYSVITWFH